MKNIAIVGLGWLGLPLAENLSSKGYIIKGTSTSDEKVNFLRSQGISAINLNFNQEIDEKSAQLFFKDSEICVITIPPSKCAFNSYRTQVLKIVSLFEKRCKFIFISSTSVYSDAVLIAQEDSKTITDFNFSAQLFLTEKSLSTLLCERLTILRFAGLVGPNRNPAKFLSGKENLPNGKSPVNLVHLEDCISFIKQVIRQNSWGEIFNVCASEHPSREEYYTANCIKNGLPAPNFSKENDDKLQKIVSNEKGKTRLNFTYKFDSPFDF